MVGFMRSPQIRQFRIQKLSHILFSSVATMLFDSGSIHNFVQICS